MAKGGEEVLSEIQSSGVGGGSVSATLGRSVRASRSSKVVTASGAGWTFVWATEDHQGGGAQEGYDRD